MALEKLRLWLRVFVHVVWCRIRWWLGGQGVKPMQMLGAEEMFKEFWNLSQGCLPLCPDFCTSTTPYIPQNHWESTAEARRAAWQCDAWHNSVQGTLGLSKSELQETDNQGSNHCPSTCQVVYLGFCCVLWKMRWWEIIDQRLLHVGHQNKPKSKSFYPPLPPS